MTTEVEALAEGLHASVQAFLAKRLLDFERSLDTKLAEFRASLPSLLGPLIVEQARALITQEAANHAKLAVFDLQSELAQIQKQAREASARVEALPSDESIARQIYACVNESVAAIPIPMDAAPVDVEALHRFILESVDQQIKQLHVPEGKPGTSVTVQDVEPIIAETVRRELSGVDLGLRELITERIAALPKPQDGKSISVEDMVPVVERACLDAVNRPDVLAAYQKVASDTLARERASAPPPAAPEVDYKKIFEQVNEYIIRSVDDAVAVIPKPENGKDADPALIAKMVEDAVKQIEVVIPDPIPGAPGKDGVSVDVAQVRDMVKGELAQAILMLPKEKAADFEAIKALVDIAVKQAFSSLPPAPAGKDGLSVKDFKLELLPDERTLRFYLAGGDESQANEVTLPVTISRDAYESGKEYVRGDSVAWDGSWWVARRTTSDVPGTSDSWKLMAQRGRNGKDREVAVKEKESTQVRLR